MNDRVNELSSGLIHKLSVVFSIDISELFCSRIMCKMYLNGSCILNDLSICTYSDCFYLCY